MNYILIIRKMNFAPILYCHLQNFETKFILLLNQYLKLPINIVFLEKATENGLSKLLDVSPTKTFPLLNVDNSFLSGTKSIALYLLKLNEKFNELLLNPKNHLENAEINMWLDFCSYNIWPLFNHTVDQITGKADFNIEVFDLAVAELKSILTILNNHLTYRTYLVGNSVRLCDLLIASSLNLHFTLLLNCEDRNLFNNVTRWFKQISSLKEFQSVFGPVRFCLASQFPTNIAKKAVYEPISLANTIILSNENISSVNDITTSTIQTRSMTKKSKDGEPKEKQAKKGKNQTIKSDTNKNQTLETVKSENNATITESAAPTNTAINPAMQLDDFKRLFLNAKGDQVAVLNNLFINFFQMGWTFWFMHYDKASSEGKVGFKTKNLSSGMLQVIFTN